MTLAELRNKKGITQAQLADALDKKQSYVGRIESGTISINNITLANAYKLAQVLGCRIEDLVDKERL